MTDAGGLANAAWALVRRDLQMFVSYRLRTVSTMLSSLFSLTLFHFVSQFVSVKPFHNPDEYYAYVVVGLVILQVLTATLGVPAGTLRQELVAGTFERLVLSPFGAVGSVISLMVFPLLRGIFMGIVTLAIAAILFGLDIQWDTAALAIPLGLLGAIAFAPFGLFMLGLCLIAKQAVGGANYIVAGLSLVSGLYFPVENLPRGVRWLSEVQPFTPAVNLLRHVLVGTPVPHAAWLELARIAGFAIVLLPLSALFVDRAIRFARRRGTLIEY
jgi:ABC-2 type transport system permease protein